MDKLIIGLIIVGTACLAIGIAIPNSPLAVVGVVVLGVGILLIKIMK